MLGEFGDNLTVDMSCTAHANFDTTFAYGVSR